MEAVLITLVWVLLAVLVAGFVLWAVNAYIAPNLPPGTRGPAVSIIVLIVLILLLYAVFQLTPLGG